jgi:methylated-DNA-[protein]-cysteine S-methyltransferase
METTSKTIYCAIIDTPLGHVLATASETAVTGLMFCERQRHLPSVAELAVWRHEPEMPLLAAVARWTEAYFAGQAPPVDMPLDCGGSDFQATVWRLLSKVPYGATTSYGEMAVQVQQDQGRDAPPAARAIGGAVGRNPISLIIPCHRVLGSGGQLTGYGGGLDRKESLLRLEGVTLV